MDTSAILASRSNQKEPQFGRPHFWPLIFFVLLLLVVAVTTLGQPVAEDPTLTPAPSEVESRDPRVYTVGYKYGVFSPTNLRIHVGDTVRWHNESPLSIRVVAQLQSGQRTPEFDSIGPIPAGGFFAFTFAKAGIYGYYNPSDSNESGVIIVR